MIPPRTVSGKATRRNKPRMMRMVVAGRAAVELADHATELTKANTAVKGPGKTRAEKRVGDEE